MAIFANFIGIDKHIAPNIRDLTGARNDATALWALFCDSLHNIDAKLILDEKATTEAVRHAFKKTLSKAKSEDTVIISFAGHGTSDHRLVTYNTDTDNLADSTISAAELSTAFKNSKAKAILLILDCCFSGCAPARVLEDSPIPRNPGNFIEEIAGEGRIIIAASNIDESAYEQPGSGHGLLTKALIDILQTGVKRIEILSAMDQVMERVRAEAAKMGIKQTPVFFGSVMGGLTLPKLQQGKHYYEEFPEAKGVKVSQKIEDLAALGLPDEILTAWDNQFKDGLNNLQLEAVNKNRILNGESLLVVAPTSSGKTFIGEMAAAKAITQGRKTVFLFPYRALTSEKYEQFSSLYGEILGMRVIRCTGDYVDQTMAFVGGKYDVALLTYEMFLNLAVSNPWVLNHLGLVVIDEAQFIADPNRGIVVELFLTYLLAAREKEIKPQIIALSAVIGGINNFDAWLDCRKLITKKRPVPLIEGVLDRGGMFQYLDTSGETKTEQLLPLETIHQRSDKPSAQDVIVPLVQNLISQNEKEKIIVFRNRRGTAEGAANYLARDLGLAPAIKALEALPNQDLSTTSARLRTCLKGGTAFHNTNLNREEKAVVEKSFRDPKSKLRVLGATTTVAAGINTPASTVIIAEQKFMSVDGREFTVAEYKNMAGRAGRVGFQEEGKAIILAETSYQREHLFKKYVMGDLELLTSSFDPQHIETWVIRLLAQINHIQKKEITRLLANTYGGYLANKENPTWRTEMNQQLKNLLERMISLGLVEQEGEYIQLTLLGRACGGSALSFESTMRLVGFLKEVKLEELSAERLMVLIQALPELDNIYTPMMKRGQRETIWQREAVQKYGPEAIRVLQQYAPSDFGYYARCKRAAILGDWIHGISVENIEQKYTKNFYQGKIGYGDIRNFTDASRFYLRSAYQIANVMFLGGGPSEESIDALLRQLEKGIPAEALDLLKINIPLERGEYLLLNRKGIKTVENFFNLPEETVKGILSQSKVKEFNKLKLKK